jgi:dephospho-CoA kinase
MIIIGLTGSIGMGKSTLAKQFANCGAAVCDSDAVVHRLLGNGGKAVEKVGKLFAGAQKGNAIDRAAVAKEVFANPAKLKQLEAILHPLVRDEQERFIRKARIRKKKIAVLDIPLLFETKGEERCDVTLVASAPAFLQRRRVFMRPQMTEEKFARILAQQMKDSEKRKRADFVVRTGLGKYASLTQVKHILYRVTKNLVMKSL